MIQLKFHFDDPKKKDVLKWQQNNKTSKFVYYCKSKQIDNHTQNDDILLK